MQLVYRHFVLSLLVVLLICASQTSAQQQQQQNHNQQASSNKNATTTGNASANLAALNATANGNSTNVSAANITTNATTTTNTTSNTTTSSTTTSTPLNYPTATYASDSPIAGTAQAPFPPGDGVSGGAALGPDDSYIAAAVSLIASSSRFAYALTTIVTLIVGGALLL